MAVQEGIVSVLLYVCTQAINCILGCERQLFLQNHSNELVPGTNKPRYISNGYHKQRKVMFLLGLSLSIRLPRILDRCKNVGIGEKFTSRFVEKYKKCNEYISSFALLLYLKGVSQSAIKNIYNYIFNEKVKGFSQSSISRLKDIWIENYDKLKSVILSNLVGHVLFIDAVYLKNKNSYKNVCILVVVSLNAGGYQILSWHPCTSETEEEWSKVFKQLTETQHMGKPLLIVTDGGAGGIAAVRNCFPNADIQRCWVHKTRNILSLLPKAKYKEAVAILKNIYNSETYEEAKGNYLIFISKFKNYRKAVKCLSDDIEMLLVFFNIPNFDRNKIYTTNPIECVFSVERLRLNATRGMLNIRTISFTSYKFVEHVFKNSNNTNEYNNTESQQKMAKKELDE
jgi:transposase-like protein